MSCKISIFSILQNTYETIIFYMCEYLQRSSVILQANAAKDLDKHPQIPRYKTLPRVFEARQ